MSHSAAGTGFKPAPTMRRSILEDERDLHGHAILVDLAVRDFDLLLGDVQAGNPADGLARALDAFLDGGVKALFGDAAVILDTLATAMGSSLVG